MAVFYSRPADQGRPLLFQGKAYVTGENRANLLCALLGVRPLPGVDLGGTVASGRKRALPDALGEVCALLQHPERRPKGLLQLRRQALRQARLGVRVSDATAVAYELAVHELEEL